MSIIFGLSLFGILSLFFVSYFFLRVFFLIDKKMKIDLIRLIISISY